MSYILEALRKADAERLRGSLPGLHTQTPSAYTPPLETVARTPLMTWVAAGLAALLLLMLSWLALRSGSSPSTDPPARELPAQASLPPIQQAPPPTAAPTVLPSRPSMARAPVPATRPPAGIFDPQSSRRADDPTADARQEERLASNDPVARPSPPPVVQDSPPPAPTTGPEPRVYKVDDLPLEIRSELPRLDISGGMYSEQATDRILIINGQVVGEGGRIGPDMKLIKIQVKTALVEFRGYRYRVNY